MKLADDISQALGKGDRHGRGWTSVALTMMAVASLGGVLWGIFIKPAQSTSCSMPAGNDPQPNVSCPVSAVSKAKRAEPSPGPIMPCAACGMG